MGEKALITAFHCLMKNTEDHRAEETRLWFPMKADCSVSHILPACSISQTQRGYRRERKQQAEAKQQLSLRGSSMTLHNCKGNLTHVLEIGNNSISGARRDCCARRAF